MTTRRVEISVGLFVLIGISALLFLALQVAQLRMTGGQNTYDIYAKFDNIGGLKIRSPIKVGGVVVGRVADITLDTVDYLPLVTLRISADYQNFSETSSVSILTSGLLGEQYVGLQPGFIDETVEILKNGDYIEDTKSALVLEELIGQFLFNRGADD